MQSVLYTLLLVMALFSSSLVMFGLPGLFVFALVGILAVFLNWFKSIFQALLSYALILLLIALLLPAVSCAREAARCIQCRNNLKQLVLALHNYQQEFNCLPPASVSDENGRPMHSWRVLILPYWEGDSIYKEYDFNEPWDGPNNKKLLAQRPHGFACPSDKEAYSEGATYTSYVAVVGSNAAWSGDKSRSIKEIESGGGLSNTILLVEVAGANIPWTEPRDLSLDALSDAGSTSEVMVSSKHFPDDFFFYTPRAGAHVALADGNVRFLHGGLLADGRLPDLLRVGGFQEKYLDVSWPADGRKIHWPHCIAFTVWIVSIVLLLHWSVRCRRTTKKRAAEDAKDAEG